MNIFVRIGRLILTFAIFIVAQALLAASINSMFELVPIRVERIFPKSDTEDGGSLVAKVRDDANRLRADLKNQRIDERKKKHTLPTVVAASSASTAVLDSHSAGGVLAGS